MADTAQDRFGQGKRHERAQGGAVEVEGEVARLWARGIEAGWRRSAGGAPATSSARARLGVNARRRKGAEKVDKAWRADKNGAQRARFAGAHDAWRSPAVCRGMGAEHSGEQGSTVTPFDRFLPRL